MEREIDRRSKYKNYKRKVNYILFLLVFPAVLMLGIFLALYLPNIIQLKHLITVFMPLTIGYLILIFNLIPKLYYNKMYADYTRLLINEPQILECRNKLFTTAWIDQIKRDGYDLVQEDMKHILLCKYYKKLPGISSSDRTLAFIVIAKTDSFDFYGDEIDNGVQAFYMKHKDYEKIDKRVTLQFKKYDQLDEQAIEEIEKAILYQAGKQVLINLSFVYNSDKQSLSGLNPNGFYPNRYAYFAFSECKRLCDIKE